MPLTVFLDYVVTSLVVGGVGGVIIGYYIFNKG